jgi:hypothetical protein
MHLYEVRPRKDHRGVDLISDTLESFLIAGRRMPRHLIDAFCTLYGTKRKSPDGKLLQSLLSGVQNA